MDVSAQFHMDPETYLDEIRAELPRYDDIQTATINAIPFPPRKVLELGVGTGETTVACSSVIRTPRSPDSTPSRRWSSRRASTESRFDSRGCRTRYPMARGTSSSPSFPSTISTRPRRGTLFRRVREQSRSLVLGDVVLVDPQTVELEPGVDLPSRASDQAEWSRGEIVWEEGDFAVIRAVYE
jgi:hypothetical protein